MQKFPFEFVLFAGPTCEILSLSRQCVKSTYHAGMKAFWDQPPVAKITCLTNNVRLSPLPLVADTFHLLVAGSLSIDVMFDEQPHIQLKAFSVML